jgi:hypothetical protein
MGLQSLGGQSRVYFLELLKDRGQLTLPQLRRAAPQNGKVTIVDLGRGTTIDDFMTLMVNQGLVVHRESDAFALSDLGTTLLARWVTPQVKEAVAATPKV